MSDLDGLYNEQYWAGVRAEEYQDLCNQLDDKIQKLESARDSIASLKSEVLNRWGSVSGMMGAEKWTGDCYNAYKDAVINIITPNYSEYYKAVDNAHDELNGEIARLQNEKWDALGALGEVQNYLNSLYVKIKNFFN